MPAMPELANFNVTFGRPGEWRPSGRRPVVTLPAGAEASGAHFTVEGDWTAPEGGVWELGLRVSDDAGEVVPVSDSTAWYAQYSYPVDFGQTPSFHDQTVFIVALRRTTTLTFERLLEDTVVGSCKVAVEVKRES